MKKVLVLIISIALLSCSDDNTNYLSPGVYDGVYYQIKGGVKQDEVPISLTLYE